jgi:hypothetical protein
MRSVGLVATQTFTFLFADIDGPAAMLQRLVGDAYAGTLADSHRLQRGQIFQLQAGGLPAALAPLRRWIARCC